MKKSRSNNEKKQPQFTTKTRNNNYNKSNHENQIHNNYDKYNKLIKYVYTSNEIVKGIIVI